jgi:serine protease Do
MQNNIFEPNDKNNESVNSGLDTSKTNAASAEHASNLSYYQSGDGAYNCVMTTNNNNVSDQIASFKRWTIVMLLVFSLVSASVGFIAAKLTSDIGRPDTNHGNNQPPITHDGINVNVVPDRPKLETSNQPYGDRKILSTSQVSATALSANVEITAETAVYNQLYGYYVTEGAGSGVIISDSGYIITNHHVIENARSITVTLSSGTSCKATLVGSDSDTDIAVLSISATEKLFPATLGNSLSVSQGDEVVIAGNPLGTLGSSVTNGIISALDRELTIDGKEMVLMQTNAPINPGNSGGGMYNMYGELIGIINAKSSGNGIEGIGFAIPINTAFSVASQIVEYGYVRGRIDHGLSVISVENTWDMMRYNVSKVGIYIYKSEFSSDLKSGDRIVSLNGVEISVYTDIKKALQSCSAGDTVSITVERRDGTFTYELTLHEYVPQSNTQN